MGHRSINMSNSESSLSDFSYHEEDISTNDDSDDNVHGLYDCEPEYKMKNWKIFHNALKVLVSQRTKGIQVD